VSSTCCTPGAGSAALRATPRLRALFEAYLAGYAFSFLTPTASIGGDVLRASLVPREVPATEAASAVTADRLACSVSDAALGLAGVTILLLAGPLEAWHRMALVGATGLFGLGIGGFFLVQRSGRLAGWIAGHPLLARLGGARLAERMTRAGADLDGRLQALHLERPEAFRGALLRNLSASLVGGLQIALLLAWLGEPAIARAAAAILLIGVALDMFSFFIPARLGVQEGSRMLGASVAGLDPSLGLLLSLLLRLDQVVWAARGLALHARIAGVRRPRRDGIVDGRIAGGAVLSRQSFFRQILASPEARELLLNSLAVGEGDSALDLDRVSAHVEDPVLSRKIYRHFAEENKHARLFKRHLEGMGFEVKPLPPELDYETLAQRFQMGTPKSRLDDPRPFDVEDPSPSSAAARRAKNGPARRWPD
jgi:hypothetical protein